MPSVQYLREFINERLTAAAEQIFLEFEKTIVQYEEEIDRQRRLLDITWKPQIKLHRTDVPQQHVCKEEEEEVLPERQLCDQERSSSLDQEEPEPPQIKEEKQQLLLMEADAVTVNSVCGERDNRGPEPDIGQLLSPSSAGKPDQEAWRCLDSGCVDSSAVLETCYVPQQHVCKEEEEEEVLPEQQLWNQERSSSVDQEDQEEQEEQGEQLVVGQQSDPFVVAATYTAHINCVNDSHVLERHCVTETGKKSVKCDVCGKAFQHRSRMIKHRRIHTGVKPYACGERFVQSAMLKTHMRSHTGETLDCKTCGRCFSQKSHLLRHMKIHTREPKPA